VFTKNVWSTKPTGHAIISGSAVTDGDPKLSSYNFPIGKIVVKLFFLKYDVLSEYLIPF
jgi:hypothetical protein